MNWRDKLEALGTCGDERPWVDEQPSAYAAWRSCQRGDWLLWVAARLGVDRRLVVRAACACAREALVYVPEGEERPCLAIETAEAWCDGRAPLDAVRAAADAADDATYAAVDAADAADGGATYAADAASAAADAAYAAYAADAADAADAAADAAASADAYAARVRCRGRSAKLVRRIIPWRAVKEAAGV